MRQRHKKKSCAWCGMKFTSRLETVRHQDVFHETKIVGWHEGHRVISNTSLNSRTNKHRQVFTNIPKAKRGLGAFQCL